MHTFVHIDEWWMPVKFGATLLKTVGLETFGKFINLAIQNYLFGHCVKMGKNLFFKFLHSLYFCPPNMTVKFQEARYKTVEKVPTGGIALKPCFNA